MKLKMEKARLEASMEMLTIEKETAAAIAKAEALEAVVGTSEGKHSCRLPFISSVVDSSERTKEYVENQAKLSADIHVESHDAPSHNTLYMPHLTPPRDDCPAVANANVFKTQQKSLNPFITMDVNATSLQQMEHQYRTIKKNDQDSLMPAHSPTANQQPCDTNNAMEARPTSQRGNFQQPAHSTGSQMTDFVRFLARRELVTTGLLQFNDRPENYRAWRRSFQNAIRDLNLTCDEEMDLLVKWLGSESTEHAKRIRSIHINQPAKGLNMIWNRLDASYGASEAIEKALFERLDRFPKIGNKDHTKLQDLSDLLMELDAAKAEGDLPGLSYLDTPRGVHAVAQKLPYSIQEKWLSHGSSYKQLHCVPFPPFSVFVSFIYNQAQIRNDPSFNFVCQDEVKVNIQRPPWKNRTREISVHKTEVSGAVCSDNRYKKNTEDPDKRCPIHNKPHTLQKCRAFREKPLEERKTFLKENGICFKCCNSSAHTARDCQTIVKCTECSSDRHSSALHPGQAPWVKDTKPPIKHGGEPEPIQTSEVTSQCTSVCGGDRAVKNCSKICLARVYPNGESDKAIKAYVIIDEQSNRSLAHSSFFDTFGVQGPAASYSLKTCSGMSENMGRVASDFCIESMDGKTVQLLPSLLECNEIPDNRAEIPTPSAALYHEHLKPIAHLIPELEPDVPIMPLLGRDIIRLHKVHKCINGPPEAPYAQKLALGWGPDLNNLLLGVLMRFRKEAIAITADIKQMFHSFLVREEDRNFLRFFWFRDNDPTQEVIEYRMTVHVFGNSPSPAVAIYCLRQAAMEGEPHHDPGVKDFVNRDFYVDDALKSFSTVKGAVSLLKNTQDVLANSNLRLHKIASNNKEVMEAFPAEDRANDLKDLDLSSDVLPEQRSLGLNWNLESDAFVFKIDQEEKPFTRRGVLSVVNSVYDPLGFMAPVTIHGKYILRELTQQREEAYAEELACLKNGQVISRGSPLKALDPFIDEHNILRVGGRMRHGEISLEEKHPKIIPAMAPSPASGPNFLEQMEKTVSVNIAAKKEVA
ncbi:PREDICTED: uncharacterized protein LOC106907997 [Poecilia mexicana]|uniref:uncharacterized protein LOC106907997 n=1 Tax=Poecilia mexicana TaxID=48701 RepID=UPI00072E148E|nr:PREDICTED: uncharacterized protein LOC106907997 [Poecilia mexicana]